MSANLNSYPSSTTGSTGTSTGTTGTTSSSNAGSNVGEGIKGIFASGHGIGESIRGNINSAIDGFTGDTAAQQKNAAVAEGGEREFSTGKFERSGIDKAL
ncbi:hypothetical protein BT93_L5778 [Corymbia citriodora subsp. variegata]|uniref:Uncharacterized protein n=1 Tax=Corymbia citriodora subsp. variegata TaxID=360336 RepID=A0A8T0CIM4_CORYI|nr:hypothetical protein BT93_L5778 [Corymbia citriodora subsp. variegata]